jgi:carbon-monoxide dehydrogenase catalytic subunit
MAEVKEKNQQLRKAKLADPVAAIHRPATQEMIERAQELGIDTVFDRAVTMKPCNIGSRAPAAKTAHGPLPPAAAQGRHRGEDTRKGLCGATANTIAARNFIRMIAGGAAAHSDHGRCVAEVFLSAARKETDDYKIKDPTSCWPSPTWAWPPRWRSTARTQDRDMDEIALEVAEKALNEWGKAEGELHYLKRAPAPLYEKWKNRRAAAQHRPRDRRDHAPHPHGRGPGLQEPDEAGHPGGPGRRLGRLHAGHRPAGRAVRHPVSRCSPRPTWAS